MKEVFTKAITHGQFLKMCGLAIVGAGAGQLAIPPKPVSAVYNYDNLYVSGNAGIGTDTPNTKLHISGGTDATFASGSGYLVIGSVTGSNIVLDDNEIMARDNGTKTRLHLQADGGDLVVHNSQPGTHFVVTDAGNVGIRTSAPLVALDVRGGSIGLDYGQYIEVGTWNNWPNGTHRLIGTEWSPGLGNDIVNVYTPGSIRPIPAMTLVSNGYIGIGTTSPLDQLHINSGRIRIGSRVIADSDGCYYA